MRAIFDHALDAIITIDTAGIIHESFLAAERIFGWRADEVTGRNLKVLMPSPDREKHDGYLNAYLQGGPRGSSASVASSPASARTARTCRSTSR